MADDFEVQGENDAALFTLKIRRGEGMALLSMNWKDGTPTDDFVGFAIEYQEPGGDKFYPLNNRLNFTADQSQLQGKRQFSTLEAPIQKFRWVHFPMNAGVQGEFQYRVTPVHMADDDTLSYGEKQTAAIALGDDTYPGILNVGFTRGFISSQAFVDRYGADAVPKLLPANADAGLDFPVTPANEGAYTWMGFEARAEILGLLKAANDDATAQVRVIAYDLNEPEVVDALASLGPRLKAIVDDSGSHGPDTSAESKAAQTLIGKQVEVKRQKVLGLQHNKVIVVDGDSVKAVVCGSTNFSWRGIYVQNNNAATFHGETAVAAYAAAFDNYWNTDPDPAQFESTASADWQPLGLEGIDAEVAFSPHSAGNAKLAQITDDIENHTTSSLFYSFAFLYQTPDLETAIEHVSDRTDIFVYGISDRHAGGIHLRNPGGNPEPVFPANLSANLPPPFSAEPSAAGGVRMHHKFAVIDFDKPTARVYFGSYNFSNAADTKNGENVIVVRDRKVATSYMVEALRIFDHYSFRVAQSKATKQQQPLVLHKPPRQAGDKPWWGEDWTDPAKTRDRLLFA